MFESRYHIHTSAACLTDAYKIYDNADVENLHSTDIVTFVGIASSESYVMMNLPGDHELSDMLSPKPQHRG